MTAAQVRQCFADQFRRLRVNQRPGGSFSPHKVCMLLAIIDLARAGLLADNRIYYEPALLERYRRFFDAVRAPGDHPNPHFPFFHLRGSLRGGTPSFWHLHAKPGRDAVLASLSTASKGTDIEDNVAYATLDPDLYALLQDPAECDALSDVLADTWFDRSHADLAGMLKRSAAISRYERSLRNPSAASTAREAAPPEYVRSPAFRRVVVEAYDYRCAATGVRIVTSSGEALVEAAHIHPFSESGDDDPRNGIALSRDMHWAMDRNLIAPGPDLKWHVSQQLDARIPDLRTLCGLQGQPLLGPRETRLTPKREALQWRLERLRDPAWVAAEESQES